MKFASEQILSGFATFYIYLFLLKGLLVAYNVRLNKLLLAVRNLFPVQTYCTKFPGGGHEARIRRHARTSK